MYALCKSVGTYPLGVTDGCGWPAASTRTREWQRAVPGSALGQTLACNNFIDCPVFALPSDAVAVIGAGLSDEQAAKAASPAMLTSVRACSDIVVNLQYIESQVERGAPGAVVQLVSGLRYYRNRTLTRICKHLWLPRHAVSAHWRAHPFSAISRRALRRAAARIATPTAFAVTITIEILIANAVTLSTLMIGNTDSAT